MHDNVLPLHRAHAPQRSPNQDLAELLSQVERLDLLLQRHLHQMHERPADDRRNMQDVMLPPDEVHRRLKEPHGLPQWAAVATADKVDSAQTMMAQNMAPDSRLSLLMSRFALNPFEADALLLSLLPFFDARYGLMYAYLQQDQQKKWPTVDTVLELFGFDTQTRAVQQQCLSPQASLATRGLVRLHAKNPGDAVTLYGERAVFLYLMGEDDGGLPSTAAHFARWRLPSAQVPDVRPELTARLARACDASGHSAAGRAVPAGAPSVTSLIALRGRQGDADELAVNAVASLGRRALSVDLELLPIEDDEAWSALQLVLRAAQLHGACLIVSALSDLADARKSVFARLAYRLSDQSLQVICLMQPATPLTWLGDASHLMMDVPERGLADNAALLGQQIARLAPGRLAPTHNDTDSDIDAENIAKRFRISPDTLDYVLKEADLYRQQRAPDAALAHADLLKAFRLRSQQSFGKLAKRMEPVRGFDDLIVSKELLQQLKEILAAVRHRDRVLEQGFGRKVGYGTGISALFYGDSGTGKTMAAEVLAGAIGIDLIKIDLSTVVNKYIGETEKNLSRIFDLAEQDAGVLFFDEADALFGKRSEVKDAQDRHANIEVSYLLQRLEAYPGLVVLSTNNRSHLDEAFSRRLTFMTKFGFPDAVLRERMWRAIWPEQVALADDVDLAALANKVEITGANIRNAALLASWLAAEEGAAAIKQTHIVQAVRRELSKLGRITAI